MSATNSDPKVQSTELGALLRYWRDTRGVSQLDLALDAGISQRHISFIESGRSVPGRQTLLNMAQSLDVPLRDRNTLLLSAGYAPMYSEARWNATEMSSITNALGRMLRQHEPFPAVVTDRYWNVLMANQAFKRFFDLQACAESPNILRLIFDPNAMRAHVMDWEGVARRMIQRVYRETIGHEIDKQTQQLLDSVMAYPDVRPEWKTRAIADSTSNLPMASIGFVRDGAVLNYFTLITTVGAPQSVAAQELRMRCMVPSDDETRARHLALFGVVQE